MDKLKNLKMSSELKDRIKTDYKKESKKPKYKFRKIMNYEFEIDVRILVAVVVVAIIVPLADSVAKFKDLTMHNFHITSNFTGGVEDGAEKQTENKDKN